jgi:hypothetical protein
MHNRIIKEVKMAVDPKLLIAAINPDLYCDEESKKEVSELAKSGKYLEAAEKAKLKESNYLDIPDILEFTNPLKNSGLKNPIETYSLKYDAFSQNLEPIYFWILDYINANYKSSEKLIDNFVSSSGSGHFAEFQQRATRMQDEAMKIFGTLNTVIRSVINIIYDLKEFKIRLSHYEDLNSSDPGIKNASMLALKQIWLDSVDFKRGNSSIKAMAAQFDFVTLIDAFMSLKDLNQISKLDLNDRVKRILEQRFKDFQLWLKQSEVELKKRYEIERTYLKSQVNSIKLYSRWLKPYLKAARDLEQRASPDASLVTSFNTALFELVLLGKDEYKPSDDINSGILPNGFDKKIKKKFSPIVITELKFRSAPDRSDSRGGYGFRGKVEADFTSFVLDENEFNIFKREMEKSDIDETMSFILGATDESLGSLQDDIDELLDEKPEDNELEKKKEQDVNPFSALFEVFTPKFWKSSEKPKTAKEKEAEKYKLRKDNDFEKTARSQALLKSRISCRKLYSAYKKAHSMPTMPPSMK